MRKTFDFKKGNYLISVYVDLENKKDKLCFSVSGNIYDTKEREFTSCGQNYDEIMELIPNNKKIKEIYRLWSNYHLNDMHAGTEKQEEFLNNNGITNWASGYTNTCKLLEENGLLYDDGYKFGTSWLYREIPEEDLIIIKKMLKGGEK